MKKRDWNTILIVALLAGLLGFALVTFILADKTPADPVSQIQSTAQIAPQQTAPAASPQGTTAQSGANSSAGSMMDIMGMSEPLPGQVREEKWTIIIPRIVLRLVLAALLAAMLAFRPRKDLPLRQRNLYVAQTQILLAVVASALMMIVGDNAARAFGIFAAVSVVRFRTNIKDPKEVTVLLISLSLGLATGVGRWDLALVLALFVLPLLWLLEARESEQSFRPMELTVKTKDTEKMQDILKGVFSRHKLDAELRQLDSPDEDDPLGCIMYYVSMNFSVSTDQLSHEIRSLDPDNVDAIEWSQTKDSTVYQ